MSEAHLIPENRPASPPLDQLLDALRAAAFLLEWPLPRERDEAACNELARLIDALFACVARGHGALEVSIGEVLDALSVGDRVFQLGYTNIGDYVRERFGLAASTAIKMARFARALRDRPNLREAIRAGEVSTRKAEAVMPVAIGDVEDVWVARARSGRTVRDLKAAVKEERGPEPEEEVWRRIGFSFPPEAQPAVDEAMALARKALRANAPKWKILEAIAQEYLSGSASADASDDDPAVSTPVERVVEPLKELLQHELEQWASLAQVQPIAAPESNKSIDPRFLDSELRRLLGMRNGWDEVFGHLALVFTTMHGARRLDFRSFEQYCEERLGMAERTVAQRAALEKRLYELPALRQAMREGRVSYEKARLLSRHVDSATVGEGIDRAERMTCIALRRALEGKAEAQMCARHRAVAVVPRHVLGLLSLAFQAVRKDAGKPLTPGECFWKMCEHFIEIWKPLLAEKMTPAKKAIARDGGLCTVPGCSRAADHGHHVEFRSQGGSDELKNRSGVCAGHHLHGVHMGWVRVEGEAPDGLRWELGVRAGLRPLAIFTPGGLDTAFAGTGRS